MKLLETCKILFKNYQTLILPANLKGVFYYEHPVENTAVDRESRLDRPRCHTYQPQPSTFMCLSSSPRQDIKVSRQLVQKLERKQTKGRTRPIALPYPSETTTHNVETQQTVDSDVK